MMFIRGLSLPSSTVNKIFKDISFVSWLKVANVSGTISDPIIRAMTVKFNHLTWLIAQEDFINVSHHESFTSSLLIFLCEMCFK
jgi:hypothetical protein